MASLNTYIKRTSPYVRFVSPNKGVAWDVTNGVESATPAWGDTDTALTWNAYLGCYPITVPSGLSAGRWDMLVYDNASPVNTDAALSESRQIFVDPRGGLSECKPLILVP